MNLTQNKVSYFRKLSVVTLVSVYVLILVGGIVRSTGAGMGCPDWPKCFGSWVPPTAADQLPTDYKKVYSSQRAEKNERLVRYFQFMGWDQLAQDISHDPSILDEEDFNAVKTWTEYVNRLVGVVVGLLVFATFLSSWAYWGKDKPIVFFSFFTLLAVGFQGWIGSLVVSTNLLSWMITVHMLIALFILCLLTYLVVRSRAGEMLSPMVFASRPIHLALIVALVLTLVQIILGTQVRESVNEVAKTFHDENREQWIGHLDWVFYVHRSYSLLLIGVHIFLFYKALQIYGRKGNLTFWMMVLLVTVGIEVASGAIMAYFAIPRFAQPLHLFLATVTFGLQFFLLLKINSHWLMPLKISDNSNKQHVSYQNYG